MNTGTVPGLPLARVSSVVVGLGPPSTDRLGMGRSRRSSRRGHDLPRRPGEPVTGRRAAVVSRSPRPRGRGSWMLSCRKDAPPNGGAPVTGVSERQATLHRWAFLNPPRQKPWRARCGESRTPGSASGLGKRTSSNAGTAPQADSTVNQQGRRAQVEGPRSSGWLRRTVVACGLWPVARASCRAWGLSRRWIVIIVRAGCLGFASRASRGIRHRRPEAPGQTRS